MSELDELQLEVSELKKELQEAYAELSVRLEEREIIHDLLVDSLDFVQLSTGLCFAVPEDFKRCKDWQDEYREVCKKYKISRKPHRPEWHPK